MRSDRTHGPWRIDAFRPSKVNMVYDADFPVGPLCDRCGNPTFVIRQTPAPRRPMGHTLQMFECPRCMRTMNVIVPPSPPMTAEHPGQL